MPAGSCQCGAIHYSVRGEPLMTYACHCRDCQRRTGSAFSMGTIYPLSALSVTGELSAWERRSEDGTANTRYSCARCGNVIYGIGDNAPDLIKLQPGTLEDQGGISVDAHIWVRSAQPWISLPVHTLRYDTQPDQLADVYAAVLAQREATAEPSAGIDRETPA